MIRPVRYALLATLPVAALLVPAGPASADPPVVDLNCVTTVTTVTAPCFTGQNGDGRVTVVTVPVEWRARPESVGSFLHAFSIEEDQAFHDELKLLDMIGFLYEIGQSSPKGIDPSKRKLIKQMYARQKEEILSYAEKAKIDQKKVNEFLKSMKL